MHRRMANIMIILLIFGTGFLFGITMDKEWLSSQQLAYIKSIQTDKELLELERDSWLAYVSAELQPLDIYVSTQEDEFNRVGNLLQAVGLQAKRFDTIETVLEKEGILITLGQEINLESDFPQLALEMIPEDIVSTQQFYLSLLRLKGEKANEKS